MLNGGDTNAAQITVTLTAGSVILTPYWWSQSSLAWVPAAGSYQLTVNFAIQPVVSSIFPRASEAQWWALLRTGSGTISSCDLEAVINSQPDLNAATGILSTTNGGTGVDGHALVANRVLASPESMSGGAIFRPLVAIDIPNLPAAKINNGQIGTAYGGTGVDSTNIGANLVWAGPASGAAASAQYRSLVATDLPSSSSSLSLTAVMSAGDIVYQSTIYGHFGIVGGGRGLVSGLSVNTGDAFTVMNLAMKGTPNDTFVIDIIFWNGGGETTLASATRTVDSNHVVNAPGIPVMVIAPGQGMLLTKITKSGGTASQECSCSVKLN